MLNKTIRVSKEVHDLLSGLARKNDSYNDVIKRLIDNYEEFRLNRLIMVFLKMYMK